MGERCEFCGAWSWKLLQHCPGLSDAVAEELEAAGAVPLAFRCGGCGAYRFAVVGVIA